MESAATVCLTMTVFPLLSVEWGCDNRCMWHVGSHVEPFPACRGNRLHTEHPCFDPLSHQNGLDCGAMRSRPSALITSPILGTTIVIKLLFLLL